MLSNVVRKTRSSKPTSLNELRLRSVDHLAVIPYVCIGSLQLGFEIHVGEPRGLHPVGGGGCLLLGRAHNNRQEQKKSKKETKHSPTQPGERWEKGVARR